jgi:hypothetical protein
MRMIDGDVLMDDFEVLIAGLQGEKREAARKSDIFYVTWCEAKLSLLQSLRMALKSKLADADYESSCIERVEE